MTGRLVKDINLNGSSSPNELIDIEGILYFAAETGTIASDNSNVETDNEEEDTTIDDQNSDTTKAIGLWKSDGSEGGTRLLRSFEGVSNLVEANGLLYFIAQTEQNFELWSSDGTEAGTRRVDALFPGSDNFSAYNLFTVNDTLFFSASGSQGGASGESGSGGQGNGYELWRWEGDDVGTKLFKNLFPDRYITEQKLEPDDETGELTLTINTAEFNASTPEFSTDSFPGNFTSAGGGNFFFTAYSTQTVKASTSSFADGLQLGGIELWFSDGTENGTYAIPINNETYNIYNPTSGSFQPPSIFNEYYTATGSSFPNHLTKFKNKLYFTANNGVSGFELWSIKNTGIGQKLVKDIHPDNSSSPKELTVAGGRLYFTADDGSGRQLWVVNKKNKAKKVKNSGKDPRHLTEIDGKLFYSASSSKEGREPWFINSKNKPQQIQDINPGIRSSNPQQFQLIRENTKKGGSKKILYFSANGGERGIELWSQNLSKKGSKATRYADIYSGVPSSDPRNLINANNTLFFTANDGSSGRELWTVDAYQPSSSETETDPEACDPGKPGSCDTNQSNTRKSSLVKNIRQKSQSSDPSELHNHRGELFFSATNGRTGFEPWVSRGTAKSTNLFKDINNGSGSSSPSSFISHKKTLFFAADDGRKGSELWISNGGKKGTKLAADIHRGEEGSSPSDLLTQGNTLYLSADDGIHGRELWSYNIKSGKHHLVRDIRTGSRVGSNPSELTPVNGQIVFAAEGNVYGRELWRSDGTKNGTNLLLDINPGGLDSNPADLSLLDGNLYFTANTYFNGRQILKLDGSGLNVTEMIGSSGEATATEPSDLYASRDQLFFSAETTLDPTQEEATSSPSTGAGSNSGSDPGGFMIAADGIEEEALESIETYNRRIDDYREYDDPEWLNLARYSANRLATSSVVDNNDASLAEDWNRYYQPLSDQSLSTSLPIRIPDGIPSTAARRSTTTSAGDSNLSPIAETDNNSLGRELWISDGRVNGNTLLKDIHPGEGSSNPQGFTSVGAKTYFSADDGQSGEELWVSDGTEAGTFLLSDINPGPKDSSPRAITEVDGAIYFSAKTDRYGRELWKLGQPETSQAKNGGKNTTRGQEVELTRLVYDAAGKGRLRGKRNTTDEFIFSREKQFGAKKADQIIGFSAQEGDTIQLNAEVFPGFKRKRFKVVNSLRSFNRQLEQSSSIIYFQPLGELYFDRNGREPGLGDPKDSGLFAVLKGAPDLNATDIGLI